MESETTSLTFQGKEHTQIRRTTRKSIGETILIDSKFHVEEVSFFQQQKLSIDVLAFIQISECPFYHCCRCKTLYDDMRFNSFKTMWNRRRPFHVKKIRFFSIYSPHSSHYFDAELSVVLNDSIEFTNSATLSQNHNIPQHRLRLYTALIIITDNND
jgi:hypothetical protein